MSKHHARSPPPPLSLPSDVWCGCLHASLDAFVSSRLYSFSLSPLCLGGVGLLSRAPLGKGLLHDVADIFFCSFNLLYLFFRAGRAGHVDCTGPVGGCAAHQNDPSSRRPPPSAPTHLIHRDSPFAKAIPLPHPAVHCLPRSIAAASLPVHRRAASVRARACATAHWPMQGASNAGSSATGGGLTPNENWHSNVS